MGPRGHTPKLDHDCLRKSCESCCRRDSRVSTLAMIKFVAYDSFTTKEDNVQYPLLQELQRL